MNLSQSPTSDTAEIEALRNDLREARRFADACQIKAEKCMVQKRREIDALARVLQQCFLDIAELKAANAALAQAAQPRPTPSPSAANATCERERIELDFNAAGGCEKVSFAD